MFSFTTVISAVDCRDIVKSEDALICIKHKNVGLGFSGSSENRQQLIYMQKRLFMVYGLHFW